MTTLRVIFIHGISDAIVKDDYTAGLCKLIMEQLTRLGVIPPNAPDKVVDQIITFERVNYSAVGQAEEDRVLAAYEEESKRLYNFLDIALEKVVFDKLRRQIITSVSDVLVYESEYWRNQIRSMLVEKITPYINSKDPVSVVGHSLGSVVAFDTLYYHSRHNEQWLAAKFKPANLFTMGSPIALFSLELDNSTGQQKPRYFPEAITPDELDPANTNPDLEPVRSDGVWYNFLDAQDLIGYPLQTLFKDKFKVEDILVQTGTTPIQAHADYWSNEEVAQRIAERLKLDWERVNK